MAFIANTAFEARVTNNRFDELCNTPGIFQTSSQNDICSAGFLCVRNGAVPLVGYSGVDNETTYYMTAAGSTVLVNEPIFACNPYDVNLITDSSNNNIYAMGVNTLGIPVPSGRFGTFTRIVFDGLHHYRFGVGNLSTELSTNKYLTINNGLLVPAASAPTTMGTPYFVVIGSGSNFTQGTQNAFAYVDVEAHYAIATGGVGG